MTSPGRVLDVPDGRFADVGAGYMYTCALRADDRTATCWGDHQPGYTSPPRTPFTHLSVGDAHACALSDNGTATCWGDNSFGQADPPRGSFTAIAAGNTISCGLRPDGSAECWGNTYFTNLVIDGVAVSIQ